MLAGVVKGIQKPLFGGDGTVLLIFWQAVAAYCQCRVVELTVLWDDPTLAASSDLKDCTSVASGLILHRILQEPPNHHISDL